MSKYLFATTIVFIMIMGLVGCGGYYEVKDPESGNFYYTTDIDEQGSAIRFRDEKTGSTITLQNSEIRELSKDDFKMKLTEQPTPAKPSQ